MTVNWIGLWTMIRREMQRLMRVPIQAVVAPLISALLFIFIFGFVVGGRGAGIGGYPHLPFVLPGRVMVDIAQFRFPPAAPHGYFLPLRQGLHVSPASLL